MGEHERSTAGSSSSGGSPWASLAQVPPQASGLVFAWKARVEAALAVDQNRHMIAGAAARTLAQCLVHPIDTVKTRLQSLRPVLQIHRPNVPQLVQWKTVAGKRHVLLRARGRALLSVRNFCAFGQGDLYRGLSGAFLGTIPVALVYFAVYERVKPHMAQRAVPDAVAHMSAAAAGAVASAFVRVPTDTVRHRVQGYLHRNVFCAVPELARRKGLRGFYAGLQPTLLRDVPEIAIQFATYEALRSLLQRGERKLATWQHLLLGGVSGAMAACATMPIDVMKTHMQCGGPDVARAGFRGAMRQVVAEGGPAALFAGMGPRVAQTALMSSIFFTLFEFWKAQLKPVSQREGSDRLLSQKLYGKKRKHIWKRQFAFR